jgi:YHS domain-containing protein
MKMKVKIKPLYLFFLISFLTINVFAQEKNHSSTNNESKSGKSAVDIKSDSKAIWNKFCPVMGEVVDPEVQTIEYKGKIIGFCCKSCIKKFKKDPEKYLQNLSEDGQKFIKQ